MSNKSFMLGCVCAVALLVVGGAVTELVPNAADGQQVVAGGKPARIRSYYAAGGTPIVVIPEVEGPHGFIITGIYSNWGGVVHLENRPQEGSWGSKVRLPDNGDYFYEFHPGIPIPAGDEVRIDLDSPGNASFTITGYVY